MDVSLFCVYLGFNKSVSIILFIFISNANVFVFLCDECTCANSGNNSEYIDTAALDDSCNFQLGLVCLYTSVYLCFPGTRAQFNICTQIRTTKHLENCFWWFLSFLQWRVQIYHLPQHVSLPHGLKLENISQCTCYLFKTHKCTYTYMYDTSFAHIRMNDNTHNTWG